MNAARLSPEQIESLSALARGIIPPDQKDAGASAGQVGHSLAKRIEAELNNGSYLEGLEFAAATANANFGRSIAALDPLSLDALLGMLRDRFPAFFKFLRAETCALYLEQPAVWNRIGFPGPSIHQGGHPDFDRSQRGNALPPENFMTAPSPLPAVTQFLAKPKQMLIGGSWRDSSGGQWIETPDPATGKTAGRFAAGTADDANAAVAAARRAFKGPWQKVTPYERGRLLQRLASLIESNSEELAQLITIDNGKPISEARREVATAISWTDYYAGWATKLTGETIPLSLPGSFLNYTIREPLGVVAGITPPNYPLTMPLYKAVPALVTGNTIVLKPAEQTSLVALRLGELFQNAGFPDGVVNIVTGYGEAVGATLASHADVDKITFTGSTEVGRLLVKAAAGNLKKVSLELGGKSPNIVFADADIEAALKGVFMGIFFCQGEICSAGARLFVEETIYDDFVGRLAHMAKAVRLGHGLDPETRMGPLVSAQQRDRVAEYLMIGSNEKATALAGGKTPDGRLSGGFFVEPTVFAGVTNQMRIAREEIFGPVICALRFKDLPDAIEKGNDSPFGLAAGVWTRDLRKAHQAAAALQAGTVWVNCYNAFDNASPWGGMKQSGWGREKGPYGLELFTQTKSVIVNYG